MARSEPSEAEIQEALERSLFAFRRISLDPHHFEASSNGKGLRDFVLEQARDGVMLSIENGELWTTRYRVRIVFHNPRENLTFREVSRFHNGHNRIQPAPEYDPAFWNSHSMRGTRNAEKESWLEAACEELKEEWGPKGLIFDAAQLQPIKLLNALPEPKCGPSEVYYSIKSRRFDYWYQLTTDYSCEGELPNRRTIVMDGDTYITLESLRYTGHLLFDFDDSCAPRASR